jgi:hypothetical protein
MLFALQQSIKQRNAPSRDVAAHFASHFGRRDARDNRTAETGVKKCDPYRFAEI